MSCAQFYMCIHVYTSWEKHGYFFCDHIYALITYYNNMCLDVTIYVFSVTLCAFVCECGWVALETLQCEIYVWVLSAWLSELIMTIVIV